MTADTSRNAVGFQQIERSLQQIEITPRDGSVTVSAVEVPGGSAVVDGSLDALQYVTASAIGYELNRAALIPVLIDDRTQLGIRQQGVHAAFLGQAQRLKDLLLGRIRQGQIADVLEISPTDPSPHLITAQKHAAQRHLANPSHWDLPLEIRQRLVCKKGVFRRISHRFLDLLLGERWRSSKTTRQGGARYQ